MKFPSGREISFRMNGQTYELSAAAVRAGLVGRKPEAVREHWVDVDGVRWPVKQAFGAAVGVHRWEFTSHIALRELRAVGFPTSKLPKKPAFLEVGRAIA